MELSEVKGKSEKFAENEDILSDISFKLPTGRKWVFRDHRKGDNMSRLLLVGVSPPAAWRFDESRVGTRATRHAFTMVLSTWVAEPRRWIIPWGNDARGISAS